jgi:peptidoglycan/xylan/chitin deacetylase (PgdA/CDA1 family)
MLSTILYRTIANLLSPSGSAGRLSILIYHRVLPDTDTLFPNEVTAERFDLQLSLLKQVFNVIPLPEAIELLKVGKLPARAASITFDDGYADNVTEALPILIKHGLHATFFIATAYLNGGRMFNDTVIEAIRRCPYQNLDLRSIGLDNHEVATNQAKRQAIEAILPKVKYLPVEQRERRVAEVARLATHENLPDNLMMTTAQLRMLHNSGMEIGGHTHRHPILAGLDEQSVRSEIAAGLDWLEQTLNNKIRVFAYPNGKLGVDYLPEQAHTLRQLGFIGAVSTQHGSATHTSDAFQLPRFTPWQTEATRFIPMLLNNLRYAGN